MPKALRLPLKERDMAEEKAPLKIAAVTDDGTTISMHFGRAQHYAVLTVEDGEIVHRELRDKLGHRHFHGEEHRHDPSQPHGFDAASHDKHARMAGAIEDVQVLLSRGMGRGARVFMDQAGIRCVLTDVENIDEAAQAYLQGNLVDHVDKLH
jgi:predicted Fe-Mo cluster-binding NifX family protein